MSHNAKPFVKEICEYIASKTDFYFGTGALPTDDIWLKAGELPRNVNGVNAVADPSPAPDQETGVQEHQISFWAHNKNASVGYAQLKVLYDLLHQLHHFPTDNYYVYEVFVQGQAEDQDRDGEGRKMLRLNVLFITRYLIS